MQNMAADYAVRMCMSFDSPNDCVSHRFKSAYVWGVGSRKEIIKTEAASIIPVTRFFGLFLNHLNEVSNDRERLRPFTQIIENVGVDHRVDIIWLAFRDSEEPAKLPQLQKLA